MSSHHKFIYDVDLKSNFTEPNKTPTQGVKNDADLSDSLEDDSGTSVDREDISLLSRCIECVTADEIEEGDHIVFAGAVYNHHAIVIGKVSDGKTFRIVEAKNTISGARAGLFFRKKATCITASSDKTFDFSKQKIWVVEYIRPLYSKSEVSERARRFADGTDDKYLYDLFDNNFEHFATYCATGRRFSIQLNKTNLHSPSGLALHGHNFPDREAMQRPPSLFTLIAFRRQYSFTKSMISEPISHRNIDELTDKGVKNDDADLRDSLEDDSGTSVDREDISLISSCIECVKAVPVFSANEIEEGDHIVFAGAVYDHYAIVVEKMSDGKTFRIVEATNCVSKVTTGIFISKKDRIQKSDKIFDCFYFLRQKIWVVVYNRRLFLKSQVSKRAMRFAEDNHNYQYHLFNNNCEHFATYCVTGRRFSIQVTKFRLIARLFVTSGFIGISNGQTRNEKMFENEIICENCYEMNKNLLRVKVTPITAAKDVSKGDIIRYSYYSLWHEAVVLEIIDTQINFVKCGIAHYARCGLFSHRTIKAEDYKICLDGRCSKLGYESPDYHVYDPDTVVKRAESRIGEQHFVFFSNDSSHYARFCKLKLEKE